jgi:hypothetical protein
MTFWRRKRREPVPLSDMAYGAGRHVLSESTRIELERFISELVKKDFQDPVFRERMYREAREAYERYCAELFAKGS